MSALVVQIPGDLDPVDRVDVAHPDEYTRRDDWATAFEFGGVR